MGFFNKLSEGLRKTRDSVFSAISDFFTGTEITDELYDELEEQLILADTGADVAMELCGQLCDRVRAERLKTGEEALEALKDLLCETLAADGPMRLDGHPAVLLVIGVNGVGKTTSIAKLAHLYTQKGKRVLLAAGDTFRAAAAEQLCVWAERAGVPVVKHGEGADPASVIFDAVQSAAARGYDMVICDTAGRLHNKKNLMDELAKISRVVGKACASASVETLLVLDAITGQNAVNQASQFIDAANATGVILTKLDGTARGGAVIGVKKKLGLPVRFIGVGEGMDDLMEFDARSFVDALFDENAGALQPAEETPPPAPEPEREIHFHWED